MMRSQVTPFPGFGFCWFAVSPFALRLSSSLPRAILTRPFLNNSVRLDSRVPTTGSLRHPTVPTQGQTNRLTIHPGCTKHTVVVGDIRAVGGQRGQDRPLRRPRLHWQLLQRLQGRS
jgi:hypothetical protein